MKTKFSFAKISAIFLLIVTRLMCITVYADDTCAFMITADDVPPNIVILLDNGASMKQPIYHSNYDSDINYTPAVDPIDVVLNSGTGNGFYNENGYGIHLTGGKYYLVPVKDDLELDTSYMLEETGGKGSHTWSINEHTITLPAEAGTTADSNGVIDKAGFFRYSMNYLNWLYFSGQYTYNGSDLPDKSRFYYAKKALMTVAKFTANQANISVYNFTSNADGASNVQPLGMVVEEPLANLPENNVLDSNYINNINNMGTVLYSPLAEGLASAAGYYGSSSSHVVGYYCQDNFVIVVTPGLSSEDLLPASQGIPSSFSDYDGDDGVGQIGEGQIMEGENTYPIPYSFNGSTYLDDVAHYLYTHDIVGYEDGFQNVMTYTVGFMGDHVSGLFLKNTSNNGNGVFNLYDTADEEYGKYHYEAHAPDALAATLLDAIKDIISKTSSFTAPVVPVTRTTSGNRIYMAFFKPEEDNFWEGNVMKFGISDDLQIVDVNGNPATWPNGSIRDDAIPYWQTKDWADTEKSNYIGLSPRNVYTYLGHSEDLTHSTNAFAEMNDYLTASVLGNPSNNRIDIINYVRGIDVFDEDGNGNTTEYRSILTGDILHSEPLVVRYRDPNGSATSSSLTMVYFGSNDGMLHAVLDEIDSNVDDNIDATNYGTEHWAFISPDLLPRLKDMVEGVSHQYYVDSSPKVFIDDVNQDGYIDPATDQAILICGERMGGTSYFALDVSDPSAPQYKWRIDKNNTSTGSLKLNYIEGGGQFNDGDSLYVYDGYTDQWGPDISARADGIVTNGILHFDSGVSPFSRYQQVSNCAVWDDAVCVTGFIESVHTANPDAVIPELGQSWSEPEFTRVKTSDDDTTGTAVFFIGGGYSSDNSAGKAILAIDVYTGNVVRSFKNDTYTYSMDFSIPSTVAVVDADYNGFADKVYVGDLGSHMWRLGKFGDSYGYYSFPDCDENINNWEAQIVFESADFENQRMIFYPPAVTLEKGYDLLFFGTGDRMDACNPTTSDRFYCVKDDQSNITKSEFDLVNMSTVGASEPDLDNETADVDLNGIIDQGWYVNLAPGEKVLAENLVFYKTVYFTTFTPNNDPCLPGGAGTFYAMNYKTSSAVIDFDNDGTLDTSVSIGGGIPSKVVPVITDQGVKLLVSVGSSLPDPSSESFDAGVVRLNPLFPKRNFYYLWWRELINM